jgi:hypothetical protein
MLLKKRKKPTKKEILYMVDEACVHTHISLSLSRRNQKSLVCVRAAQQWNNYFFPIHPSIHRSRSKQAKKQAIHVNVVVGSVWMEEARPERIERLILVLLTRNHHY